MKLHRCILKINRKKRTTYRDIEHRVSTSSRCGFWASSIFLGSVLTQSTHCRYSTLKRPHADYLSSIYERIPYLEKRRAEGKRETRNLRSYRHKERRNQNGRKRCFNPLNTSTLTYTYWVFLNPLNILSKIPPMNT